jgi:hypothetical protein
VFTHCTDVVALVPLPPEFPAANTTVTPAAMSWFWSLVMAPVRLSFSSALRWPLPHELLTTTNVVPTPTPYRVAPGAAPWNVPSDAVPSPATIPATWVPCPPAPGVSVSSMGTATFGPRHSENPRPGRLMATPPPGAVK